MAKKPQEIVRYTCLACARANDFIPTSRRLCAYHDPGQKKRKANLELETRVEERRLAALEAIHDERLGLHREADDVRSVASESRTVTTAKAKCSKAAAAGTRPITQYLAPA